jgi:hypothetical protein
MPHLQIVSLLAGVMALLPATTVGQDTAQSFRELSGHVRAGETCARRLRFRLRLAREHSLLTTTA